MKSPHPYPRRFRRDRSGATLIVVTLLMTIIVAMVTFSIEVGRMAVLCGELQNAVDAGALAASLRLRQDSRDVEQAAAAARDYVQRNRVGASMTVPDNAIEVEIGQWDSDARSFTGTIDSPNAVRVFARQVDPYFFGMIFGLSSFNAPAQAIASGAELPLDIMLVLDLSGSMRSRGRIEALQNSAPVFVKVIEELGGDDQIGVMGYGVELSEFDPAEHGNGTPYTATPLSLSSGDDWVAVTEGDLTDNFSSLTSRVLTSSNLKAKKYGGGTPIGAGLRDGAHYLVHSSAARWDDMSVKKVIVLMSDGHANKPSGNGDEYALDMATYAAGLDITVHTISLGNSADLALMQEIADQTGGLHVGATGSGEAELTDRLTSAFKRIAISIKRSQLVQ